MTHTRALSWHPLISILLMAFASIDLVQGQIYSAEHKVQVNNLPSVVARSAKPSDVLLASLETVLHDETICCGKDSALEDSVQKADPMSLKDVASKLQGRHLLSDGRPIEIHAEFLEASAINSGSLISTLREQHALLMEWNSHIYVCHGVTYRKDYDATTRAELHTIRTFLLWDARYQGSTRRVVFNRETDDWSKVQGMLWLTVSAR